MKIIWSYINMSCHTENDDYVKRYEKFASEIEPECSKMGNKVDIFITTHSCFSQLSADRFGQLIKILNRDLELFRDENVPLNAALSKLSSNMIKLQVDSPQRLMVKIYPCL